MKNLKAEQISQVEIEENLSNEGDTTLVRKFEKFSSLSHGEV